MIKRLLTLCLGLLALGGCSSMSGTVFPHRYALGVPTPAAPGPGAAPAQPVTLRLARIDVPSWLEGTGLYYRLVYRHDGRIAEYSHARWVAPPAIMLERVLEQALRASGHWQAVLGPDGAGAADASLHLRLNDFSQHFASRDDSYGVVDATATLVDDGTGHVVAQKQFHVRVGAPTPDAEGGVKALGGACADLARQLRHWLPGRLRPRS